MIRIIVAEDNNIVRKGITALLNDQPDMNVVGEAENGVEALELLNQGVETDILLADLNMPKMDGLTLAKEVTSIHPLIRIIILTMHLRSDFVNSAIEAGAKGYLLKDGEFQQLYNGIRKVFAGETFINTGS